jgi:hypothetical protein
MRVQASIGIKIYSQFQWISLCINISRPGFPAATYELAVIARFLLANNDGLANNWCSRL